MGQKVNPHGLRVGVIKDWDSKWYAEDKFADYLVRGITFLGVSIPNFWVGLMLLYFVALKLDIFLSCYSCARCKIIYL